MKNQKKLMCIVLSVIMLVAVLPIMNVSAKTSGIYYYSVSNGKAKITSCELYEANEKDLEDLVIPSTLGGYPVTAIGSEAFSEDTDGLLSVTIPDTVTSIGEEAFAYCKNLTDITLPDTITEIGYNAFYKTGYYNDSSNWEDGVLYIGNYLIDTNSQFKATSYEVKEGTICIAYEALYSYKLEEVTIPASVIAIDSEAFGEYDYNVVIYGHKGSYAETYANKYYFDFVDLDHVHSYTVKSSQKATCTKAGVTVYVCDCGNSYKDYSDPLGHKFSTKWTIDKKATCTKAGSKSHHCTRCSAKNDITSISATGHSYESKVTQTASCTEPGVITYTCKSCGDSYEEPISALDHNYSTAWTIDEVATCTTSGTKSHHCKRCDNMADVTTIKATGHNYKETVTVKASTTQNGTIVSKCTRCNRSKGSSTVYKIASVTLSATSYTYNGKTKKPTVTVTDTKGNALTKDTDYTVSYSSGRKNVGKYTVTVTFKGKYGGSKKLTFTINPKGTTISKLTAGSKKFTATWTAQATQTSGYQIQYSTSSKMKNATIKTYSNTSTTSKSITGLNAATTYYVQIRTYKTVDGTKYYSSWSSVKSVKTK